MPANFFLFLKILVLTQFSCSSNSLPIFTCINLNLHSSQREPFHPPPPPISSSSLQASSPAPTSQSFDRRRQSVRSTFPLAICKPRGAIDLLLDANLARYSLDVSLISLQLQNRHPSQISHRCPPIPSRIPSLRIFFIFSSYPIQVFQSLSSTCRLSEPAPRAYLLLNTAGLHHKASSWLDLHLLFCKSTEPLSIQPRVAFVFHLPFLNSRSPSAPPSPPLAQPTTLHLNDCLGLSSPTSFLFNSPQHSLNEN